MNKATYLKELSKALKVMPKKDREEVIAFYEEYFNDAGEENEASVIEELGSPKELAKKILVEVIDRKYSDDDEESEEKKKDKSSLRDLWLVILGIFAIPLSPVALALIIVVLAVIFAVLVTIIALILSGFICVVVGIIATILGLCVVFSKFTAALTVIGIGLITYAVGALLIVGFGKLLSVCCSGVASGFAKIVRKNK